MDIRFYISARNTARFCFFSPARMTTVRLRLLRTPDAGPAASGGASAPRKPLKTGLVPESDAQLAELGVYAATYWLSQPWLTLRFTSASDFLDAAMAYQQALTERVRAGAERPSQALRLLALDAQINEHLYRVKALVTDKYDKKSAPAYFAKMGIAKENESYILPRERTKRSAALGQLVQGLTAEGFVTQVLPGGTTVYAYGTAFWEPIATEYASLLKELTDITGLISDTVGDKDMLREKVETGLRSLAKALDAHYPDRKEFKAQIRAFGFQRESY
jgi:hypothetical protein